MFPQTILFRESFRLLGTYGLIGGDCIRAVMARCTSRRLEPIVLLFRAWELYISDLTLALVCGKGLVTSSGKQPDLSYLHPSGTNLS